MPSISLIHPCEVQTIFPWIGLIDADPDLLPRVEDHPVLALDIRNYEEVGQYETVSAFKLIQDQGIINLPLIFG